MITPEQEKTLDALAKDFEQKAIECNDALLAFEKALVATGDKEARKSAASLKVFKQFIGSIVATFKSRRKGDAK